MIFSQNLSTLFVWAILFQLPCIRSCDTDSPAYITIYCCQHKLPTHLWHFPHLTDSSCSSSLVINSSIHLALPFHVPPSDKKKKTISNHAKPSTTQCHLADSRRRNGEHPAQKSFQPLNHKNIFCMLLQTKYQQRAHDLHAGMCKALITRVIFLCSRLQSGAKSLLSWAASIFDIISVSAAITPKGRRFVKAFIPHHAAQGFITEDCFNENLTVSGECLQEYGSIGNNNHIGWTIHGRACPGTVDWNYFGLVVDAKAVLQSEVHDSSCIVRNTITFKVMM